MLTRNRRKWIPQAIRLFRAQTYPSKELLIVADGEGIRDLVPPDSRIRLLEIEEGYVIGQKRNFGVAHAAGEIIAHWDDDDYSAPERLAQQIAMLLESGKSVAGYSSMYFTDGREWWQFKREPLFAIGSSLCYRKDWWRDHPFTARQVGEDGDFARDAAHHKQIVACEAGNLMVASIHPGNTSPRNRQGRSWRNAERPEGIGSPCD